MPNPSDREIPKGVQMSARSIGILSVVVGVLVLAVAAFISYEAITEAYGSGPPYYSRTTNMDKWSNPLPALLLGDAAAILVAGLLMRAGMRRGRAHKR